MDNPLYHSIEQLLQTVEKKIHELQLLIEAEQHTMTALKDKGLIYAGTWMKAGKYLYLIHPSDGFGYRRRQYIGADPTAIQNALDGIQRATDYDAANHRKRRITNQLDKVTYYLRNAAQC